jgi:hypothetical protein
LGTGRDWFPEVIELHSGITTEPKKKKKKKKKNTVFCQKESFLKKAAIQKEKGGRS